MRPLGLWGGLIIEELIRTGVRRYLIAPGSRSTPLTVSAARHPEAETTICFDERGAGFAAVGYTRATGEPCAVICTSGTAVAELLPAVIEASLDGLPLIVLSGDRPPEARTTGANQTIEQPGIFGGYVRSQVDLPVPTERVEPSFLLTTIDQAVYQATGVNAGPVHLNCMFAKPLEPDDFHDEPHDELPASQDRVPQRWRSGHRPYTTIAATRLQTADAEIATAAAAVGCDGKIANPRLLVVIGLLPRAVDRTTLVASLRRLETPIVADITSGCRGEAGVIGADLLLGSGEPGRSLLSPDAVVHVGTRLVSARLQQLLEDAGTPTSTGSVPYVLITNSPARFDPGHIVSHRLTGDLTETVERLVAAIRDLADGGTETAPDSPPAGRAGAPATGGPVVNETVQVGASWAARVLGADRRAAGGIDRILGDEDPAQPPTEPQVARDIARLIPTGHTLVAASSMPIRELDTYAAAGTPRCRIIANRGASGIDGTLATAIGAALGTGTPTTLLIGDLALMHDASSLALLATTDAAVTIVAINNDGGGIFHFLPIAEADDVFEPYFATPHGRSFEGLAAFAGVPYVICPSVDSFRRAYSDAAAGPEPHPSLIEVRTSRAANPPLHRRLSAEVAAALRQP